MINKSELVGMLHTKYTTNCIIGQSEIFDHGLFRLTMKYHLHVCLKFRIIDIDGYRESIDKIID